jgi:uncharacterized membrane protein YbhN (UPF0104 family)
MKHLSLSLKLLFTITFFWYASKQFEMGSTFNIILELPLYSPIIAVAFLFGGFLLTAIRMRLLLLYSGWQIRKITAFNAVLIGAFFGQTFISFIGGDAMRIWKLVRSNIPFGDASRAVLYDRLFGFLGLTVLIILGIPFLFSIIDDNRIHLAIFALLSLSILVCTILLSFHRLPPKLLQMPLFAFGASLAKMGNDLVRNPRSLLRVFLLSFLLQTLNVFAIYILAQGLNISISFFTCIILIPPVMFISMLPISIAGWGIREGAMVAILSTINIPANQSLALSITYGLLLIVTSLPGGVFWLAERKLITKTN